MRRTTIGLAGALVMSGLSTASNGWARQPSSASQAAARLNDFDFVVRKIEANYAGYDVKVTPERRVELAAVTARLRTKAAAASDQELLAVLQEWVAFFRDGHVAVSRLGGGDGDVRTKVRTVPIATEAPFRARLEALGPRRDPIEGVWVIGQRYRVAIMRMDAGATRFEAVVLDAKADGWRPGMVKAELRRGRDGALSVYFVDGGFVEHRLAAELVADGAHLQLGDGWGGWTRAWPTVADLDRVAREVPSDAMFLKRLSPATMWLRLPDFGDERADVLKTLLRDRATDLASSPNLVIDLRGNGGGSDRVYAPLLPLLYTQPIYSVGIELRASADNAALRQALADRYRAEVPDAAATLDRQNKLMRDRPGGYVQPDPKPFSITRFDAVLPSPKRVVVLIDGAGSSGEQFILDARQSRKVTLMGRRNSAGVLDFANVVSMPTPSGRYEVHWAISRSLRLPEDPVDPDGIAPHVAIPKAERDPVRYAQAWLERQVD